MLRNTLTVQLRTAVLKSSIKLHINGIKLGVKGLFHHTKPRIQPTTYTNPWILSPKDAYFYYNN